MTNRHLLERNSQLGELKRRFLASAEGSGQIVLLGGEAGSGKTSLVQALIDAVPSHVIVRLVSCDAAGIHGALGPVLDIADTFGSDVSKAIEEGASADRLSRMILSELRTESRPNLLVAEDLHWADQATLSLIRFLARRLDRARTLLIGTFRDDPIEPNHPLRLLIGELANQTNLSRMSLPPLSLTAVTEMVDGRGLDPLSVFELTGGNPFFISEIIDSGGKQIPGTIRDVVLARAARLDLESSELLEFAAVAGPVLDPELLQSVVNRDLANEVEACMRVGLLGASSDGITFRHALTRDVLLAEMTPFRRRDLARRILQALETNPERAADPALMAHFAEEAGLPEATRTFAVSAAHSAARQGAHRESALQYDRALRNESGVPSSDIASWLEARSFELHVTSQNDRALVDISRAIEIRAALGDFQKVGDDLRLRSRYNWIGARSERAESDALAALAELDNGEPSVELAMACSNLAQLRMLSDRYGEAIEWGERAIALATVLDTPQVLVHALTNVGSARLKLDSSGWDMLDEAEQLGRRLALHDDVSRIYCNRAFVSLHQLQLDQALRFATEGLEYTEEHDIFSMGHYLQAIRAIALAQQGNTMAGESELVRLMEVPQLLPATRILTLTELGLIQARRAEDPTALLDEALVLARHTNEVQRLGPVYAARAEAAWLANDSERSRAEAQLGLDVCRSIGDRWMNGALRFWLHRAGVQIDQEVPIPDPYGFEIDGQFQDAASMWHSLGYPFREARALERLGTAEALLKALELLHPKDARTDVTRITRQLRLLGVATVPRGPRGSTRDNPAMLTEREIDVLRLLAQGKTNREIAEELYISPRTCGHHVSAIFGKLDVHSRAEATTRATELGLK